jgi:hypothetical protein
MLLKQRSFTLPHTTQANINVLTGHGLIKILANDEQTSLFY